MVLSRLKRWLKPTPRPRALARSRIHAGRSTFHPRLEVLEDRTVPATLDHFAILAPESSVAGDVVAVTIVAEDEVGEAVTDFAGTIRFASTDEQAILPDNFTFSIADEGTHTFEAILRTTGTQSITVYLVGDDAITGAAEVSVSHAAFDHFAISAPETSAAGEAFHFTIIAQDAYGNTVPDYRGTVTFTSSDEQAGLPDEFTFTLDDQGECTFVVILYTAGSQDVTLDDAEGGIGGSVLVHVSPGAFDRLAITAPDNAIAGEPFGFTITAQDFYGNTVRDYTGTVTFSSSDEQATLPDEFTFTEEEGGEYTFTAMLRTAGFQWLTATNVDDPDMTANALVDVEHAALDHFALVAPDTAVVDEVFALGLVARDAFGNTVHNYLGTVHFRSSDEQATLPDDFTFSEDDRGEHTFDAILRTPGTQTLTVHDLDDPSLTGSADVEVLEGTE